MKALVISDTHGIFNAIYEKNKDKIPDYDVIFLLGDHSQTDIKIILDMAKNIPVLRIAGNHDVPYSVDTWHLHGQLYKIIPTTKIETATYTGWSGSHKYKDTQYYGYTQEQSVSEFKAIPKANILFSHDGPYNKKGDDAHCGLKGITLYLKKNKPKSLIYGHYHKPMMYKFKKTKCFCVYQMAWFDFDSLGNVISYKQLETI